MTVTLFVLVALTWAQVPAYDIEGNRMDGFFQPQSFVPFYEQEADRLAQDFDNADMPLIIAGLNITVFPAPRPRSAGKMLPGAMDTDMWADVGEQLIKMSHKDRNLKKHSCQYDANTFCHHAASIAHCLVSHFEELESQCKEEAKKSLPFICKENSAKRCDVAAEPIFTCLKRIKATLSSTCASAVDAVDKQVSELAPATLRMLSARKGSMETGKARTLADGESRVSYGTPILIIFALVTMAWLSVGNNAVRAMEAVNDGPSMNKKAVEAAIKNFDCPEHRLGRAGSREQCDEERDLEHCSESEEVAEEYL